jgi:hypothetical protein
MQARFVELLPMIMYMRNETAVIASPKVGGVELTGVNSPLVDGLCISD